LIVISLHLISFLKVNNRVNLHLHQYKHHTNNSNPRQVICAADDSVEYWIRNIRVDRNINRIGDEITYTYNHCKLDRATDRRDIQRVDQNRCGNGNDK